MKIAYGTYAMPTVPLEDAFPALAKMGYEGIELFIGPKHDRAMPQDMDAARRKRLRSVLGDSNLTMPAMMIVGGLYQPDPTARQANLDLMAQCAQLGRDLGMREPPVLAMGFGGRTADWDTIKGDLVETLLAYAELAEREDFIVAGEAHCNAAVDRSERITWLLDTANHPRVRLHFDIVHLFLAGEGIEDAVSTLLPYTAHTHITDARRHADGTFELLLLGDGELDSVAYMRAMKDRGWKDFITLEVSTRVWSQEGYDPYEAARYCYRNLSTAFEAAGVPRG